MKRAKHAGAGPGCKAPRLQRISVNLPAGPTHARQWKEVFEQWVSAVKNALCFLSAKADVRFQRHQPGRPQGAPQSPRWPRLSRAHRGSDGPTAGYGPSAHQTGPKKRACQERIRTQGKPGVDTVPSVRMEETLPPPSLQIAKPSLYSGSRGRGRALTIKRLSTQVDATMKPRSL